MALKVLPFLGMKKWEEYKHLWSEEVIRLRYSENRLDKMKYSFLEEGLEMSCIPPVGIELSVMEYRQLKETGYNLHEIHGWCYSGKDMHERVRLTSRIVESGRTKNIGMTTPRKGYYYVRKVCKENAIFLCYYNYQRSDEFIEETVEISKIPFYNFVSIGPKKQSIGVGDIIEVKTDPVLVEYSKNGHSLNSYKIEWNLIKHPKLSYAECDKIRHEIDKLKEEGNYCERIISDAECDRAEVRACIKDKLDLSFTDNDIENAQKEIIRIKEQIAYYEGLLNNL